MGKVNPRALSRQKRKVRVRKKIKGTNQRPRLCVFRSSRHIYAQLINDVEGGTVVAVSTMSPYLKEKIGELKKTEAAKLVGQELAKAAQEKGVNRVIFDRNGFLYHGRVKALSEGAREAGLEF
jgi:large subunit ribosomal protein L18